jgi:hypothetical protein
MGELGLAGLALLLALLATAVLTARSRLGRAPPAERPTVAAIAAVAAAFGVAAGIDWMWELTAVTAVGALVLGLLAGPATNGTAAEPAGPRHRRRYFGTRAVFVAVAVAIVTAEAIPLLAQTDIQDSREAAARAERGAALREARDARSWQPWAASPHLQLALVHEEAGRAGPAREEIDRAIDRDRADWRLWLVSARMHLGSGFAIHARRDFRRAERLNPRSRLLAALEPAFTGQAGAAR